MASYRKVRIENGYVKGTEVGVSVTIGASVKLDVDMHVRAQTVTSVYSQLEKHKHQFSEKSWEKIEKAHVGGGLSFFFGVFDLMLGGSYNYQNKTTEKDIKRTDEAQHIARAIRDAVSSEVSLFFL